MVQLFDEVLDPQPLFAPTLTLTTLTLLTLRGGSIHVTRPSQKRDCHGALHKWGETISNMSPNIRLILRLKTRPLICIYGRLQVNIAPTIICAFLIKNQGMDLAEALMSVKKVSRTARPTAHCVRLLATYEEIQYKDKWDREWQAKKEPWWTEFRNGGKGLTNSVTRLEKREEKREEPPPVANSMGEAVTREEASSIWMDGGEEEEAIEELRKR